MRFNNFTISVLLFITACLVYGLALDWGLPTANTPDRVHPWGPDEIAPMGFGELYFTLAHPPHPHFDPRYPLFHYFIQALACGPYLAFLWITGGISKFTAGYPYGFVDPVKTIATLTVLGRLPSLLMGAGVIVAAQQTATMLWNRWTGLLTGTFVLLLYPMFYYARTSNTDVPALFWTSLGLAVFAKCLRDQLTTRRAIGLGVCSALAAATKDANYAAFLLLPIPLVFWQWQQTRVHSKSWKPFIQACLAGAGSAFLTYVIASGLIFNSERYFLHLDFIIHGSTVSALRQGYGSTPATLAGYWNVVVSTAILLFDTVGPLIAILAVGGLVLCWRRDRRACFIALPAIGMWLGVILPVRFVQYRFVFVMAYVLSFFAAYVATVSLNHRAKFIRRATLILLVLASAWSLARGVDLIRQSWRDARYETAAWLQENTVPGDRIAFLDGAFKLPALAANIETLELPPQTEAARLLLQKQPEFVMIIPQLQGEIDHEFFLLDETYQALRDHSLGYQQVLGIRSPSWFSGRSIPFVNPPVKIFVRKDVFPRINPASIRIDISH